MDNLRQEYILQSRVYVSSTFVDGYYRIIQISHSDKHNSEKSEEIVCNARHVIEESPYESNFVVANCRFDVLLVIPWHKKSRIAKDYSVVPETTPCVVILYEIQGSPRGVTIRAALCPALQHAPWLITSASLITHPRG